MLLYPNFIPALAIEDLLEILGVLHQVIFFGDNPDTNNVARQRNIPEPTFLGNVGDGGCAFIHSGVAHGALVVGPDGDLVQIRVSNLPSIASDEESVPAAGIDGDWRVEFPGRAAGGHGFYS